jgi:hypothetical protein
MIAHQYQQSILWKPFNHFLEDIIHQVKSLHHQWVVSMKRVTNVINSKKMSNEDIPVMSAVKIIPKIFLNAIINCIYVTSNDPVIIPRNRCEVVVGGSPRNPAKKHCDEFE